MKQIIAFLFISYLLISCTAENRDNESRQGATPIAGTWQLIKGTIIEKGDTLVTDYTKNISFIKIINDTHFAFLQHDKNKGKDSTAVFVAGGGSYLYQDGSYTENLEYCSARDWEGNKFVFRVTINADTLTQVGTEKVEDAGVNRINIENYVRVKR